MNDAESRSHVDRGLLMASPAARLTEGATRMPKFIEASMRGDIQTVRHMLRSEKELDVNGLDEERMSALHWASAYGEANLVRLLLSDGRVDPCIPNKRGGTPLHQAVLCGAHDVIVVLLDDPRVKSNIDSINEWGETSLILSATKGDVEASLLLLENGASRSIHDKWGKTAEDVAFNYGEHKVRSIIKDFVPGQTRSTTTSSPKQQQQQRSRALSKLMEAPLNEEQALEWISSPDIDINSPDYYKLTALHKCSAWEKPIVLSALLSKQSINVAVKGPDGDSALHTAASAGAVRCATLLIDDARIPVDQPNDHGATALMLAASSGIQEMVELLVGRNANPNLVDSKGRSAWNYAKDIGHESVAGLLWHAMAESCRETSTKMHVPPPPRAQQPARRKLAPGLIKIQEEVQKPRNLLD